MSTLFSETIAKAISDYRFLLRRFLDQSERQAKLAELNLRDPSIYDSDLSLYEVAWNIVNDIARHAQKPTGYYAYSGVSEFGRFLKEYLEKFDIENGLVVHAAQKASKAMIKAIQLVALPETKLNDGVAKELNTCSELVAKYGSEEQHELYQGTLEKNLVRCREFFEGIYDYYRQLLSPTVGRTGTEG